MLKNPILLFNMFIAGVYAFVIVREIVRELINERKSR
jgi:hypothetical protein